MAERRMFAKTIIDSDKFLDMPLSAQALYFHLSMRADDEGFISNPKKIMRMIGSDEDSMKLLIAKQFIIPFESGIVVIKHWRIHNYIQSDRFKDTICTEERKQLGYADNKEYVKLDTECIHDVSSLETQYSIGKISIDKDNKNNIYADSKSAYESEFDTIWKLYPRKEGKSNACKAYIKARKDGETKESILDGLNRYLTQIKAEETPAKFIKHGSTWFNQRCWHDEYRNELDEINENRPDYLKILKIENNEYGGETRYYADGYVRVYDGYDMMVKEIKPK